MQTTTTYEGLIKDIVQSERMQNDYLVPSTQLAMEADDHMVFNGTAYKMRDVAHTQVANKLQIPKQFYDRTGEYPGLRSTIVNRIMNERDPRTHFVRTEGGEMRALLSDRFKPLDHSVVLNAMAPTMREMREKYDTSFKASVLTEKRMYLQLTFPRLEREVVKGDAVQFGLTISNSEVGFGMVKVSPTIWRLICSNGMIRAEAIKSRHVGRQLEMGSDYTVLSDEAMLADMKAFKLKLRDTIKASVNEAAFHQWVDQLTDATTDEVRHATQAVRKVSKLYNISEEWEDEMINNMAMNGNMNRYGVANAVTNLAHMTENGDVQFHYETAGADIIDMPRPQWQKLIA